jgi:hypothetical protein
MFEYFYNTSLRRLVVGFGTLFNSIYVQHDNPDNPASPIKIRVPITYAPQEKFIRRLLEPSSITDGTRIETQLPKLSYIMTSVRADASRRRNRFSPLQSRTSEGETCSNEGKNINEQIPVNVSFSLFLYTRHIDDTLQIVEQILPYFNPDHIIEMDMNEAQSNVRIPITLLETNISERFDGDFANRRLNISSLTFMAKTFIYGPVRDMTLINDVGNVIIEEE